MSTNAATKRHRDHARRLLNGFINPLGLGAHALRRATDYADTAARPIPVPAHAPVRTRPAVRRGAPRSPAG